ncbi:hypothetical protein BDP27DRAFT_1451380 [Rhodocollybia butyracea]|uniref:Uncharacterized protein n=1 Tax=Rhodocollybia butyracea TaxID=206335 RepID=A0A9P5U136_9AGAR|nr:hypothetical protein BDP27DRAFT_1451380 [Rhodocollybia butyracea]
MSSDDDGSVSDGSVDNYMPFVLPTTNPTLNDFRNALNHSQEREQKFIQHNAKLRNQVSALKSELKAAQKSGAGRGRKKKTADPLLNHDKIILFGKKYAITVAPWVHGGMFMTATPPNAPAPNLSARFASFESYQDGAVAELQEYLSTETELQEQARSYAPFQEAFTGEVNIAANIFGGLRLPLELWTLDKGKERGESPEFRKLLVFPGETHPKVLIPLYYPELKKNNHLLFMNDYLPALLRVVLFGKSSLTAKNFKFGESLVGRRWNVRRVNDSMIAFAAIASKYMVSMDETFVEIGQDSKIPYHNEFYKIRRYLTDVQTSEYYQQLQVFWNTRVFKGLTASDRDVQAHEESDIDDMTTAMMAVMLNPTQPVSVAMPAPAEVVAAALDLDSDLSEPPHEPPSELDLPENLDALIDGGNHIRRGRGCGYRGCGKSRSTGGEVAEPAQRTTRAKRK